MLFLIFINDLKLDILSLILKFAEDTKVFGRVSNSVQRQLLQDDLDKLCVWADSWQMECNVAKCKAMHIGSRNKQFSYTMKGHQLDVVATEKDLGVFISSNLKAAEHCYDAYCKANKMLGLVQRTIKHRSPDLMVRLYKSSAWYGPIWSTAHQSGIHTTGRISCYWRESNTILLG